jgi:hypothetical protein
MRLAQGVGPVFVMSRPIFGFNIDVLLQPFYYCTEIVCDVGSLTCAEAFRSSVVFIIDRRCSCVNVADYSQRLRP